MRKGYIISIIGVIIAIVLIIIGITIVNKSNEELNIVNEITYNNTTTQNTINANIDLVTTNSSEEKTSPNCQLVFKKYYKKCEHITVENKEIPEELVNKTREEIEEFYSDWKVVTYNDLQILLYKEEEGICNEHYIIKVKDGYIAIYTIDENAKETLQEVTQILTAYLPEEDLIRLEEGIQIQGKENLNQALEDYE